MKRSIVCTLLAFCLLLLPTFVFAEDRTPKVDPPGTWTDAGGCKHYPYKKPAAKPCPACPEPAPVVVCPPTPPAPAPKIIKEYVDREVIKYVPVLPPPVVPRKTELALTGSFVNAKKSENSWRVTGEILFPITPKGYLVFGPGASYGSNDDANRAGVAMEWNWFGQKGGPFLGVSESYFLQDMDGESRMSTDARAGFKIPVGNSAAVKVYAEQTVAGRGKDGADLTVNLGAIVKF